MRLFNDPELLTPNRAMRRAASIPALLASTSASRSFSTVTTLSRRATSARATSTASCALALSRPFPVGDSTGEEEDAEVAMGATLCLSGLPPPAEEPRRRTARTSLTCALPASSSACSMSWMRSLASSMPTDRRMRSSGSLPGWGGEGAVTHQTYLPYHTALHCRPSKLHSPPLYYPTHAPPRGWTRGSAGTASRTGCSRCRTTRSA